VTGGAARNTNITVDYEIPQIGSGENNLFTINSLKVRSNMESCKVNRVLEYWNKYACAEDMDYTMMEAGTMPMCEGAWIEVFDNEYVTTNLAADVMTITINFDQQYYLGDLLYTFSDYDGTGKPPNAIYIHSRLRTFDSISGSEVSDYVTIKVIGTGQSLSAACNFETLLGFKDTGRFTLD
jgi:hypothetical protein